MPVKRFKRYLQNITLIFITRLLGTKETFVYFNLNVYFRLIGC